MGLVYLQWLPGPRVFLCRSCRVHCASLDDIMSKDFQGRYGQAFLINSVVNVALGPSEDRELLSGLHTVNDIYCTNCLQILGWRYEKAYAATEKYKEGKYILERHRLFIQAWW